MQNKFEENEGQNLIKYCFGAGTLIHTKDGLRPTEDIKVGDLVLGLKGHPR